MRSFGCTVHSAIYGLLMLAELPITEYKMDT